MLSIVNFLFQVVYFLLFIRVILSWVAHHEDQPIVSIIYKLTDPLLKPFQNLVPAWRLGVDISPILAGFSLWILKMLVMQLFF